MRKYILLLTLIPSLLFSQKNNGDNLKFEIIKATVNFFATDSVAYYKFLNGKSLNCSTLDYACIADFCKKNDVGSVQKKVEEWKAKPSNSADDVKKLSALIIEDLSKKEYRKNLDSFKKFTQTLNQLAASFSESKPEVEEEAETPQVAEVTKPEVVNVTPSDSTEKSSNLPIISLIIAIIALLAALYAIFKGNAGSASANSESKNPDYHILKEDLKEIRTRLSQRQNVDFKPIEDKLKSIENRLGQLENQPRTVEFAVEKQQVSQPIKQQVTQQPSTQSLFAKLPDNGNSFSQSILTDNQNGEQIYEIQVSGDKGTFVVSNDANAQKYALSDFNYYLPNACDMLNQPTKGARIVTIEKGTIAKSGGNWVIQNKAKIEFK